MRKISGCEEPTAERAELFVQRHGWWLLFLVTIAALLPGIITTPLSDVDEARFSGATLEMIQRGEWVVPYFNGEYRFDKPPLIYWLQRLNFAVFGVNEFAARLHSLAAAAGVALLIFNFGRRLFSAQAGFIAAFAWLTCFQVQLHGRAAVADMPMIFCIVLAHRAIFELLTSPKPPRYGRWFWTLYFALGVGFLAKGPIMLAVPMMTLFLHRLFWRKPFAWKSLQPTAGLLICLSIVATWAVPALLKTDGLFWKVGIGDHIIRRGSETLWLKTTPLFYLMTAFLSLAPWTACLFHGARMLRQSWNRESAFLLAWSLGPYLIFSFYATQIPHYVMPAFPAIFLLLFQRPWPIISSARREQFWFWAVMAASTIVLLVITLSLIGRPFAPEFDVMRTAAFWFLAFFFGLLLLAFGWRFGRLGWLLPGLLLTAFCMTGFMVALRRVVPTVPLQSIFQQMPKGAEFIGFGYSESTLVYYSRHVWQFETEWENTRQQIDAPGVRCVVCLRREFKFDEPMVRLLISGASAKELSPSVNHSEKLDSLAVNGYHRKLVSGISFERASWVELEVFFRTTN